MTSNLDEAGLEALIVDDMVVGGWIQGSPSDFNRSHAIDIVQLAVFLSATQPELADDLDLSNDSTTRRAFLNRLQGDITRRGIVNVLRDGVGFGKYPRIELFYGTPTPGNSAASEKFAKNRFSVTRQLQYSNSDRGKALDLGAFINGLPIATFELKNNITKQTVKDAEEQYQYHRDPRELLFQFGRCVAHFAVDDQRVSFCTQLSGKTSWFLPFDMGFNDGAGNPPNPNGLKTDYLWKDVLATGSLTDLIENYAQIVVEKNKKTGKKKSKQIFPRFHQLDVVRRLLDDVRANGAGSKYLIQHSAGSGKSNSIAWLVHQLIGVEHEEKKAFDTVIVVTDRRILDTQIKDTIKSFMQVGSTVVHADHSGDLKKSIESGKKIIVTTLQKFPFIVDAIGGAHRAGRFAIVIDEAHSSQGGQAAAAMSRALSESGETSDDESAEDAINRIVESRKMLPNASYFAFTATPKVKTLETFGVAFSEDGKTKFRPFHGYTMKQAIQEGFILDVLANFVSVDSYYKLIKTVQDDPEYDAKRAQKKLRRYVEGNSHAVRLKAEIMVDHFHEQVIAKQKIGGEARSMVVTGTIERAIQYYFAISKRLEKRKSPYRAIVAFSGEHEYKGKMVTEASLNGFPSNAIADQIQEDPFRILVCADKFQTGYDEPLLHTMYVDKTLSGVKAVQTLSRLNRAHPKKYDVAVLDFANDADAIQKSFEDYYRTTILSEETDPNKLHDLQHDLAGFAIYTAAGIDEFIELYLASVPRDQIDPILDISAAAYVEELDEDDQIEFKGKSKAFVRTYGFLAGILPYSNPEWEKLSIFLTFLIPKLPAPEEDDLSAGILEAIDMDSYRVEKREALKIALADENAELEPASGAAGGHKREAELDRLSMILQGFNDQFGDIPWTDADRILRVIEGIPGKVSSDEAYRNAQLNSDEQNAQIEHDRALLTVMTNLLRDNAELFKQFSDNEGFSRWLTDYSFNATYKRGA